MRNLLKVAIIVVLAAPFGGCSQETRPALGTVHGIVTVDGKPLASAGVVFQPEGPGRDSMGVTDGEGKYTLTYIRDIPGATVGWHTVRITAGDPPAGKPEPVPSRYNAETMLRINVKPGHNVINFALTSK